MAPKCVCGHKASEHRRQMGMRTACQDEHCQCKLYAPDVKTYQEKESDRD